MSPQPPRATYRLQLHAGFTFDDACAAVPYLARLGVSHLYCSPIFLARPGSMHGYDMLDPSRINPELGGEEGFARLTAACREHGLGVILDFVPNHMGVGGSDNPLWKDVLEWGEQSPHADWFDIDWRPEEPTLQGRVLLPFLGRPYGDALADGELGVAADAEAGELAVAYYEHRFPLAPETYAEVLARAEAPALQELAGAFAGLATLPGGPDAARERAGELKAALRQAAEDAQTRASLTQACESWGAADRAARLALHELLERQHFRLAYWRVAGEEINYRRFFDINGLAGLRVEREDAFAYAHGRLLALLREGAVQGVRLDHVDGLYDPPGYCARLQRAAGEATGAGGDHPLYLLVEKILAPHEALPEEWPVDGTTGYDFLNLANGVLVDPEGERPLTRLYSRYAGREDAFEAVLERAKRQIVRNNLASELGMIARAMHRIAKASWRTRDFTLLGIRSALIDILAEFPVYRTYVGPDGPSEQDQRYLSWAIARAKTAPGLLDASVYDFIESVLSGRLTPEEGDAFTQGDVVEALRRFEQTSPPVMAKSMEDTAFYRYHRLISLNEVGGEPARFSVSPAAFHLACRRRAAREPGAMNASATHDHKRGEDVRARLNVLSERPLDWAAAATRWTRMNRALHTEVEGAPAPGRNVEYLFYQSLVGAWPLDLAPEDADGVAAYRDRLWQYMQKAVREAKERTSWASPAEDYEAAVQDFIVRAMDPARRSAFLRAVRDFVEEIAPAGAINGLAQTVLKLTAPGAPDIYQGTEFWDFSLVDPDNRRPVEYGARAAALDADPGALTQTWRDGRIKLDVVRRLLALRVEAPALFAQGGYAPVSVSGPEGERALAFERSHDGRRCVVVAPRLSAAQASGDPELRLDRAGWGNAVLDYAFDGGRWVVGGPENTGDVSMGSILSRLPVAVWMA